VEDIGFRVLAAGNEPDFRTISDFRKPSASTVAQEIICNSNAGLVLRSR
jgi:hypothetical protein